MKNAETKKSKLTTTIIQGRMMLFGFAMIAMSSFIVGCGSTTLYVIDKQDIVEIKPGATYTGERHGYFLSDLYMEKVMEAKVRRSK